MKIRSSFITMMLLVALSGSYCIAKNIIFDFGGVLILTDKMASFKTIGLANAASCSFQLQINPFYLDRYIKSRIFELMNNIPIDDTNMLHPYHITYDEKGNALPPLMCGWLQGYITSATALALIEEEIKSHPSWFKCRAEKQIILNLARLIFTPELFVSSRKISSAGISFIKKCKREGHNIYGLSNWDAESFEILKTKHPELFDLFDGIIISAHVNANKPHETIYHALLDHYQLHADDCWFIDDQIENIEAAQKIGINAIQHTSTFCRLIKNIRLAYSKSV